MEQPVARRTFIEGDEGTDKTDLRTRGLFLPFSFWFLVFIGVSHAQAPHPGDSVDLAPYGHAKTWDGNPGVEWDESREVNRVEVDFPAGHVPPSGALRIEYWVSSWPQRVSGGWTKTDTAWQGEWRAVQAEVETRAHTLVSRFKPLTGTENPNASNVPGFAPTFRKTLKVRLHYTELAGPQAKADSLRFAQGRLSLRCASLRMTATSKCYPERSEEPALSEAKGSAFSFLRVSMVATSAPENPPSYSALRIYGNSRWNQREINLQSGLEGKPHVELSVAAYNGVVLGSESLRTADPSLRTAVSPAMRLKLLYTEHQPDSNDRTILTIRGASEAFGVSVDDIIEHKGVYVRPLGVFLGDGAVKEDFAKYLDSGTLRPGQDIISRTFQQPEQTLKKALAEVPRLAFTARSSRHPLRYIPLGFPTAREKYGLDFNGNVFVSKASSKAMKEDLARMLWQGDEIYFRFGTGTTPDFREHEVAAKQALLDDYLPLVTTWWEKDGIDYKQEAYATLLDGPLDDVHIRGDEPSLLFIRLNVRNPEVRPAEAQVWFLVSPRERMTLKDGLLLGTANSEGSYANPRLRARIEAAEGTLDIRELAQLAPSAGLRVETAKASQREGQNPLVQGGNAVLWKAPLPAQGSATLNIKIPFRTMVDLHEQEQVKRIRFETRLNETLNYWRNTIAQGMRIQVPDGELNRFFKAGLQHILVSGERDVKTGLEMCPCGTYDYNMFANETDILVRLLDMRGLHNWAWRCLRPMVELQGSKPFPGNFRNTAGIFHGVRIDADHDYTSNGYNLNHGWTLWTLAEHYLYTRDDEWLRRVMPHLLKAADWIISERQATMQRESDGTPVPEYGLLPAGQLEDNEDFEYWFAVNGYAYRGLRTAAEAVAAVDSAAAARLSKEAEAYRVDIRRAGFRGISIAPVVALRDGTFAPAIPPRTSLHGRDLGWIRNILYGAHTLVDCGVFDPDEPVATWILQDQEDNLFMAEDSFSVPDRDWFSRGGITLQPNLVNTFVSYLKRDQIPQALRAFYNDFAASYYPDVAAFTEWVPTFGIGGGPFFKTSDEAQSLIWLRLMLVREEGERLYFCFGAPRAWFLPGEVIRVEHAATFFGETGFDVESHADQGYIQARLSPPRRNRPREILLRLRNPEGKKMTRVELNGKDWRQFDAERETITIPGEENEVEVQAHY